MIYDTTIKLECGCCVDCLRVQDQTDDRAVAIPVRIEANNCTHGHNDPANLTSEITDWLFIEAGEACQAQWKAEDERNARMP